MQTSFSELEYESKKKQTRRDRFLSEIEAATPWSSLTNVIAPFYPASGKAGRPPIGLEPASPNTSVSSPCNSTGTCVTS